MAGSAKCDSGRVRILPPRSVRVNDCGHRSEVRLQGQVLPQGWIREPCSYPKVTPRGNQKTPVPSGTRVLLVGLTGLEPLPRGRRCRWPRQKRATSRRVADEAGRHARSAGPGGRADDRGGAPPAHAGVPGRLTPVHRNGISRAWARVSVMSLFCRFWVDEGRCTASLGSSGHTNPRR